MRGNYSGDRGVRPILNNTIICFEKLVLIINARQCIFKFLFLPPTLICLTMVWSTVCHPHALALSSVCGEKKL